MKLKKRRLKYSGVSLEFGTHCMHQMQYLWQYSSYVIYLDYFQLRPAVCLNRHKVSLCFDILLTIMTPPRWWWWCRSSSRMRGHKHISCHIIHEKSFSLKTAHSLHIHEIYNPLRGTYLTWPQAGQWAMCPMPEAQELQSCQSCCRSRILSCCYSLYLFIFILIYIIYPSIEMVRDECNSSDTFIARTMAVMVKQQPVWTVNFYHCYYYISLSIVTLTDSP